MPLYQYTCLRCGKTFDAITSLEQRGYTICPKCSHIAKRDFTPVRVVYGSNPDNWPDHYWDNAEKIRQKTANSKAKVQAEKMRFSDKETMQKLNNKITNEENAAKANLG